MPEKFTGHPPDLTPEMRAICDAVDKLNDTFDEIATTWPGGPPSIDLMARIVHSAIARAVISGAVHNKAEADLLAGVVRNQFLECAGFAFDACIRCLSVDGVPFAPPPEGARQ